MRVNGENEEREDDLIYSFFTRVHCIMSDNTIPVSQKNENEFSAQISELGRTALIVGSDEPKVIISLLP